MAPLASRKCNRIQLNIPSENKVQPKSGLHTASRQTIRKILNIERHFFKKQEIDKASKAWKNITNAIKEKATKKLASETDEDTQITFLKNIWKIMRKEGIKYNKNPSDFLTKSILGYKKCRFTCDNSSLLIHIIAGEMNIDTKLVWAINKKNKNHCFITTDDYVLETTNGKFYPSDLIPYNYEYVYELKEEQIPIATLAREIAQKQHSNENAEKEIKRILKLAPDCAIFNLRMGEYYISIQNLTKAFDYLQKSIELFPKYIHAHYRLTLLLNEMQRFEEARTHGEMVLKFGSQHFKRKILTPLDKTYKEIKNK